MQIAGRHKTLLGLIWIAFLLRGAFYCVQQPLWEGFDEYAHFAYIQHVAESGQIPSRDDLVSEKVRRSLVLVPLPESAAAIDPAAVTHDAFWKLDLEVRAARERELLGLEGSASKDTALPTARQYEAQQPPLYYFILTPIYRLTRELSLPGQVWVLRLASLGISSLIVLLTFAASVQVLDAGRSDLAILATALLATLPGLFIDICRIGNESLTMTAVSAWMLGSLYALRHPFPSRKWLLLGTLAGVALLSKAYTVAFLPVILLVAAVRSRRFPGSWRANLGGACVAYASALALGGWWYVRQWITTGTISGEQLDVSATTLSFGQKLASAIRIDWRVVADNAAFSHIWLGGWSFLVVRSWMYRVLEAVAVIAALGLCLYAARTLRSSRTTEPGHPSRFGEALVAAAFYVLMLGAMSYHTLVIFTAHGTSTGLGWYLYAVISAEAVLVTLGLRHVLGQRWAATGPAAVCVLAIALDVYTVHLMLMPYYTGMTVRRPSGSLETFRIEELIANFGTIFERLSMNEPVSIGPTAVTVLWLGYLAGSLTLLAIAVLTARRVPPPVLPRAQATLSSNEIEIPPPR